MRSLNNRLYRHVPEVRYWQVPDSRQVGCRAASVLRNVNCLSTSRQSNEIYGHEHRSATQRQSPHHRSLRLVKEVGFADRRCNAPDWVFIRYVYGVRVEQSKAPGTIRRCCSSYIQDCVDCFCSWLGYLDPNNPGDKAPTRAPGFMDYWNRLGRTCLADLLATLLPCCACNSTDDMKHFGALFPRKENIQNFASQSRVFEDNTPPDFRQPLRFNFRW